MSIFKLTPFRAAAVAALVAISGTASAQNLLINGSFELGSTQTSGFTTELFNTTNMTGWSVVGDNLAWFHAAGFGLSASDGVKFLDLTDLPSGCSPCGGVTQTITTVPGESYVLSFDLGSSANYQTPASIGATITGAGTQTFTSTATGGNNWETVMMPFVASSASTTITLVGTSAGPSNLGEYVGLDKVAVVASPIPEPGAWALMLAGLATVGSVASRRRVQR